MLQKPHTATKLLHIAQFFMHGRTILCVKHKLIKNLSGLTNYRRTMPSDIQCVALLLATMVILPQSAVSSDGMRIADIDILRAHVENRIS